MKKDAIKKAQQINSDYLKSISIEEIIKITQQEDKDKIESRANTAHVFWKVYFNEILKKITFEQTMKMGKEAETIEQVLFCRGIIRGLQVVNDWFEEQNNIAVSKYQPEENFENITEE